MGNQTGSDQGAAGCLLLMGALFALWLLTEAVRKLVEAVTSALQSLWQFAISLVTSFWNAVMALLTFLVQPRTVAVGLGVGALSLLLVGLRKYLAGLCVTVGEEEALIVERWGRQHATLYRGQHALPFGALVRSRQSLKPMRFDCNEEEFLTGDYLRVRVRCSFDAHIIDPGRAHAHGTGFIGRLRATLAYHQNLHADLKRQFAGRLLMTTRQALTSELMRTDLTQLLGQPELITQAVTEQINLRVAEQGLKITNFQIEELIQPDELLRLRRVAGSGDYREWNATAHRLRQQTGQSGRDSSPHTSLEK